MSRGRFRCRVQASLLVQEVQRTCPFRAAILTERDHFAVIIYPRGVAKPVAATFHSWAEWEGWKLQHPDQLLTQQSYLPPSE